MIYSEMIPRKNMKQIGKKSFGWVIVDVIASATLLTLFFKKRNEKPIDKYKKDLSKSYKKSKKKFSKKLIKY